MKVEARKKLAELPITWREAYTERTLFLKEMYEDIIGPGSYFRWEGKNTDTGDEYYVVVSPANVHKPTSEFFSGVRKLPSDYAAYGEYFAEIREAIKYAHDTWGTPIPADMRYYNASDLKGLHKKTKEWKGDRADKEEKAAAASSDLMKEGMARRVGDVNWENREGYAFLNIKNVMARRNPDYGTYRKLVREERKFTPPGETTPVEKAVNRAKKEKNRWTQEIMNRYGLLDPDFYQLWVAHKPEAGTQASYIWTVGPHATNPKLPNGMPNPKYKTDENGNPITKFGIFHRAITTLTREQVLAYRAKFLEKIRTSYPWMEESGITFSNKDLEVPEDLSGEQDITFRLSESGKQKWATAILDWYRNAVDVETTDGKKMIAKRADLPKLRRRGVKIREIKPLLTPEVEDMIKRNPEGGWKSALGRMSQQYIQEWNDAYARTKALAVEHGFAGENIDASPEVAAFLDTTPKPPEFNEDKMKMNVGSVASGPIYFSPPYMLKKKNYFEKPDLNGKSQIELLSTKDLQVGDKVTLVAKVSAGEKYRSGRSVRVKTEIPLGVVTQVDPSTNVITLDKPIAYANRPDLLPWAIISEKASGETNKTAYSYDSLFDAYNSLRANVSPHIEVPEFTQNVDSTYLREAQRRKELGEPPPPLRTRMISQDEQSAAIGQMKEEYAPAAKLPEEVPEEVAEGVDFAESATTAPTKAPATPAPEKPESVPHAGPDYAESIVPSKKKPGQKTKAAPNGSPTKAKPKPGAPEEIVVERPDLYASAMLKLVKLAEAFDANHEYDKAEEVHKILRKYF